MEAGSVFKVIYVNLGDRDQKLTLESKFAMAKWRDKNVGTL